MILQATRDAARYLETATTDRLLGGCHSHFLSFEHHITPQAGDLERSLAVRRSVRRLLRDRLRSAGMRVRFHPQGSFRLLTAVCRDGLDLDDGLLVDIPHLDAFTVDGLHNFVFRVLRDERYAVFAREPCVRLLHCSGIRLDIVLYVRLPDGRCYLAHRGDGWVPAHSSMLVAWFESPDLVAMNAQVRRMVKYYKYWAARQAPYKMPSGVIMTILLRQLGQPDPSDDVAFVASLENVLVHFRAGKGCLRPTPPCGEELFDGELTASQRATFVEALLRLVSAGRAALAERREAAAVALWQREFGPLFGRPGAVLVPEDRVAQLVRVLEDHEFAPVEAASFGNSEVASWTR